MRDAPAPEATAALVEDLATVFAASYPPDEAALLRDFARAVLRRASLDEDERDVDVLAPQLVGLLDLLKARGDRSVAMRAFNPDPEVHGYSAPGAVVELTTDDAPFLVESVVAELQDRGLNPLRVLHPVLGTARSEGKLVAVGNVRDTPHRESVQQYLIDRPLGEAEASELEAGLAKVVADLQAAVRDFVPMTEQIEAMVAATREGASHYPPEEVEEAVEFLRWLVDDHFVFLGYREYRIVTGAGGRALEVVSKSGLGILSHEEQSRFAKPVPLRDLPRDQLERYLSGNLLVVSKTNSVATVHRRARMDYVGVRRMDADGRVAGELRLVGLFTAKAYMERPSSIPLIRRKLEWIVDSEELIEGSHDYRAVVQIFDSFPKEELFSVPREELSRSIAGLLALEEQRGVRLFVRNDLLGRNVSILVALPRERFNPGLRRRLQELFLRRFNGTAIDYRLSLGEAEDARIHFTVWVGADRIPDVSFADLEKEVADMARSWEDRLTDRLRELHGTERGAALASHWASRFPDYYKTYTSLNVAGGDIVNLDRLVSGVGPLVVGLQTEPPAEEQLTRLSFYHRGGKLALSQMMPLLEHLGLHVIEEVPTRLIGDDPPILIHDFGVLGADGAPLDLASCGQRIEAFIAAVWRGEAESDTLSRLIVTADLEHAEIAILRAYVTYWRRVTPQFTSVYVHRTLARHPGIAAGVVRLFRARFDPADGDYEPLQADLLAAIDGVESLDEDTILRSLVGLVSATVRTNAYRPARSCLALKLRSQDVPGMPQPMPLFEIFVYGRDVEGVHLRGGMVARGGIRWSERREDYRTEVLGLMKAQMTKNAVIVPTGAKGGFVLRAPPETDVAAAVRSAYETFIRGLLEVTDNLVDGDVSHPSDVVVHDGPDPYLVVAADRGTASFSDFANELAAEYGFWLGDAFASGGSAGYDHKELAITARGAWESVKHHFHEMGVDADTAPITVVGIGDMSGDVFGNGMMMSPNVKLVAAFDHRHIFLDPNPAAGRSLAERSRLFALPQSSWDDFDRSVISAGGGVYSRKAKRVSLSEQARHVLGTDRETVTPDALIRIVLAAPVDLLWNGGIGTYVKAKREANSSVGDRANDAVRVDARALRCRVAAEGGNLGFTQRGRIEYAERGGRIYADFIDNSGGVHCSDREVNLKVLLALAERRGLLDPAERAPLIAEVAGAVTDRVVYENFLQAQILTQEQEVSSQRLDAYEDLMQTLEQTSGLDRQLATLPGTDEMVERSRLGQSMTTPELAVLLAYAKRKLADDLLASELPDAPDFWGELDEHFPAKVVERFGSVLAEHPLRRELIATIVANEVIDSEGITYVSRLAAETGAAAEAIVRAYRVAREVTGATDRWAAIEALGGRVAPAVQHSLMSGIDELVERTSRWHLAHTKGALPLSSIRAMRNAYDELSAVIPTAGSAEWADRRMDRAADLVTVGVPEEVARRHVFESALVHAPDVIELSSEFGIPLAETARLSFVVADRFHLDRLRRVLDQVRLADRWQRSGARVVEDDLARLRRQLMVRVIEHSGSMDPVEAVAKYIADHRDGYDRLTRLMRAVSIDGGDDLASVVVAVRRIERLVA